MTADEDRDAFERAMRGVRRLDGEKGRVVGRRKRAQPADVKRRVELDVTRWGGHQQGIASGVDDFELRRLELGDYPPELRLDLHGVAEDAARDLVRDLLRRALRAGLRCVVIVHGRGLRSPDGPVLKRALPRWLAEPPHGKRVLAFTTAGKYGASGGATVVLLERA